MIKTIIKNAGTKLREQYYSLKECNTKEKFDLVTDCDLLIEKMIIKDLNYYYPDYSIFSEEIGQIGSTSRKRWIIDPIDGTADFVFGVPYFSISKCLEYDNEIIEGYVYNPISDEFYYSKKEEGKSFLNGKLIKVSQTMNISESLIAFGYSTIYEKIIRYYSEWKTIFETCKKGMPLIAPALTICNVARGRIDAYIDFGSSMEGQSAAALILKNAGGQVFNYDLGDWNHKTKGIIATNGKLDLRVDIA
jgi:myo-inositol-1(or 4)-monophosphatase